MIASPNPTPPHPDRPVVGRFGHLPTLDGWRGVAIAMVIVSHLLCSVEFGQGRLGPRLTTTVRSVGYVGVQVFFAISGFLICSRLLHEVRTRGGVSLKSFYVRRVFRILPASIAFLAVIGLLMVLGPVPPSPRDYAVTVAMASNYVRPSTWCLAHFWSLAVEEHFYLIWPALLVLSGRSGVVVAVGLALAVAAWRAAATKFSLVPIDAAFGSRTDLQADGLLWGCAFAFLYESEPMRARLGRWLRGPAWAAVLAVVVVTSLWGPADWKVRQLETVVARVLMPALIVGTVLHPRGVVGRMLEAWPLKALGWISYSLYLWQQLFVYSEPGRPAWLGRVQSGPWAIPLALACAAASYWLLERPMVRLGHRLTRPRRAEPTLARVGP